MSASRAAYENVCADAYAAICAVLILCPELRDVDELELWERWQPLADDRFPDVDPQISWLQWSNSLKMAREHLELPPLELDNFAYIFPMADAGARDACRYLKARS